MLSDQKRQTLLQTINSLKLQISNKNYLSNKELIAVCKKHSINLIDSKNEPHLLHEILETAVNLYLLEKYGPATAEKINTIHSLN